MSLFGKNYEGWMLREEILKQRTMKQESSPEPELIYHPPQSGNLNTHMSPLIEIKIVEKKMYEYSHPTKKRIHKKVVWRLVQDKKVMSTIINVLIKSKRAKENLYLYEFTNSKYVEKMGKLLPLKVLLKKIVEVEKEQDDYIEEQIKKSETRLKYFKLQKKLLELNRHKKKLQDSIKEHENRRSKK